MGKFWQQRQPLKVLGIELRDDGFCYCLVECGREYNVLYEGRDFPALSFDALALATDKVEERQLSLRNVGNGEMLELLHNEMQVTWGLAPEKYQLTWFRPDIRGHEVLVGLLENVSFQDCQALAVKLAAKLLALVPTRLRMTGNVEELYYPARHAALVAAGLEQDLNFLGRQQQPLEKGELSRRYLLAAKAVGGFTGVVLGALLALYGFGYYKVYAVNKTLGMLQQAGEDYDFYLSTRRQISALERRMQYIGGMYPFRTEQVEQILDAMPDSDNEIKLLRSKAGAASGLVLEGRMGEARQLRKFVEQLNQFPTFGAVTIGSGKNLEQGGFGYTLNIIYGGRKYGK